MQNDGFVLFYRSIIDSKVFDDPKTYKVWSWILFKANYQPTKEFAGNEEIKLEPGEFFTTNREASEALKMSASTVYRIFQKLESETRISLKVKRKGTVIKVLNWRVYQPCVCKERNTNETQIETRMKRHTYYKKNNNNKNNNNNYAAYDTSILEHLVKSIDEE